MDYHNPAVSIGGSTTLDDEPWQPVSHRYAVQLRVHIALMALVLIAVPLLLLVPDHPPLVDGLLLSAAGLFLIVFTLLFFVWVPRRVRHTRYLLRRLDVHVQRGLWWRKITSVTINRIQHLEVTQGPIERLLGLSRLVLFTAGGMHSDLMIPGLPVTTARQLKVAILTAAGHMSEQEADGGGDEFQS